MIVKTEHLTLDEFVRLYDKEGPFELIDGERIILSPPNFGHTSSGSILRDALYDHIKPRNLGWVNVENPFVLTDPDDPNWVTGSRVPDVVFYKADRIESYKQTHPNWKKEPLALVPDLVVEIVSPNDRYSDINAKVERYLKDGVPMVWVLEGERETVTAHAANSNVSTTYRADQKLTGGDVIPGFEITVGDIFR